jgi:hypothetical protein
MLRLAAFVLERTLQPIERALLPPRALFPPSFGCVRMPSCALLASTALLCILVPALSAQSTPGWLLGPEGMSCDDACPREPGTNTSTCSEYSLTGLNSMAVLERIKAALDLTDFDCNYNGRILSVGPSFYQYFMLSQPHCPESSPFMPCTASESDYRRLCCCGGPCPLDYIPKWISAGVNVEAPLAHWTFDGYACPFNSRDKSHSSAVLYRTFPVEIAVGAFVSPSSPCLSGSFAGWWLLCDWRFVRLAFISRPLSVQHACHRYCTARHSQSHCHVETRIGFNIWNTS